MPNEGEHAQLALHNMEVASHLLQTPRFCDWVATVSFYSALHIVEAVLASKRNPCRALHGHDHQTRERILKENHQFKGLWQHYRQLRSFSSIARYLEDSRGATTLFETYLPADQVRSVIVKTHLGGLLKSAGKFVSKATAAKLENAFQCHFGKKSS